MHRQLLAVLVVLAVVAYPVTAGDEVVAIDADHDLATEKAAQTYHEEGVVSTNHSTLDLSLTIAKESEDAGLDGFHLDSSRHYLRIDYDEEIARTVRIYVPADYWHPHEKEELQALNDGLTADLAPTPDREYTSVTVHLYGPTDAVIPISKTDAFVFDRMDTYRDWVNNTTGYSPPKVSTGQWEYAPASALSGNNTTHAIETKDGELTMQYDADPTPGEQSWLTIPKCDGSTQAVCQFQKQGVNDRVYVLSKTADPPAVRYKHEKDTVGNVKSAVRDLKQIPSRIMSDIGGIFGGD